MQDREQLLREMTLQEKVSLLAGSDMWHTMPVKRLGIPAIKVSDGPNGARGGGGFTDGVSAACFPAGIALASTWNVELVRRVGEALGQEVQTKSAHVLLAPTVNIHRSPLNGRNFECYSEDPYLSGRMAIAYIQGVQSQGVGATIKHYVCNDSEYQRNSISSEVGERALREIYLAPFFAAIQEAHPWAVMASYNKVNGIFASENPLTLREILRNEWGFDGIVMSDWFGTQSTADAVNAGLDLEMPGPGNWRGEKLLQAVERGEVLESTIDESVRRILLLIERTGAFEHPDEAPEQAINRPEHQQLAREAAAEGIVLLRNEQETLPLQSTNLSRLAVIGPNAKKARIMAGGSAQVHAHYAVTPFDALVERAGKDVQISYEPGCTNHKLLPLLEPEMLQTSSHDGERGFAVEYFNGTDLSREPIYTSFTQSSEWFWMGQLPAQVNSQQFSMRASTQLTVPETGTYAFSLVSAGFSRLYLNGQEVVNNWENQQAGEAYFGMGSSEVRCTLHLNAGQPCRLVLEYSKGQSPLAAVRLGCLPPVPEDSLERAAALAAQSDVALVFVGLSEEWESEGFDRSGLELVGQQVELIERVAAANSRTIVVLNTGSPIEMPWLNRVAAVMQAWYPGQECGHAIADVLFGDVNPSGKLTQTFPMRLEDNPAFINYPGERGQVHYGEGIFVGYRYYEKKRIEPLFPFGFGLSYSTFTYSNLQLSAHEIAPDESLQVSIQITNTSQRPGQEIIQLYLRDPRASVQRPEKELKAFHKVYLEPGESREVTFSLSREALAYYDTEAHAWYAEAGVFEVLVGSSSVSIHASDSFQLTNSIHFAGSRVQKALHLTIESRLGELLKDPRSRQILEKHLPEMANVPLPDMALNLSLDQIAGFVPDLLTAEILQAIGEDLKQTADA